MNRKESETTPFALSGLSRPLSSHGWPKGIVYLLSLLGMAYLLNPGWGILELIPDNLPFIGNLDEGAATLTVWYGLMEFLEARRLRRANRAK
jgi:uncharacterized membrane protein YkvA (DUF1232 family)